MPILIMRREFRKRSVLLPTTGKLGHRSPGEIALRFHRAATAHSDAPAGDLPARPCDPHRIQRGDGPHDRGLNGCWVDEWRQFGDDSRFGERLGWW